MTVLQEEGNMEELERKIQHLLERGMKPDGIVNVLLYKKENLEDIAKAMMRIGMSVNVVRRTTGLNREWLLAVAKKKK